MLLSFSLFLRLTLLSYLSSLTYLFLLFVLGIRNLELFPIS